MTKTNQIIKKGFKEHLKTGLLHNMLTLMVVSGVICGGAHAFNKNPKAKKVETTAEIFTYLFLLASIAVVGLVLRADKDIASTVVHKYLRKEMNEHPELAQYKHILLNPQALEDLATFVSNSLHPSDQKQIIDIVKKCECGLYKTLLDYNKTLCATRDEVIKVINNHAAMHPEFAAQLLTMVARADINYAMYETNVRSR